MSKETNRIKQKGGFDEENRRAELAKHRDAVMQWELFRPILGQFNQRSE
jgi:hypothetical protein